MKQQGYLVARNRAEKEFFTSSSAYDRPQWIAPEKATAYRTIELAENALKKLLRHGAYEARVVPLSEALEFEMPDSDETAKLPSDQERAELDQSGGNPDDLESNPPDDAAQMVAGGEDLPADGTPQDDEDDSDAEIDTDISSDVDNKLGLDPDPTQSDQEVMPEPESSGDALAQSVNPDASNPDDIVGGNEEETDIHEAEVPVIKFKNKDTEAKIEPTPVKKEETIAVPANVMSELRAAITEWKKQAGLTNARDDDRATFALTVVAAYEELADLLSTGDYKMAQVKMTSWMSPITNHLPVSVIKFVTSGGKKPSLKDLFDSKRAEKKVL